MHRLFSTATSLACAALAIGSAACARDAAEAISAQRFEAPGVTAGATSIQAGVTAAGVGRARIEINGPTLYQGAVGFRAYLSSDQGVTFSLRRPEGRYSSDSGSLLLSNLAAGVSYQVKLVTVSNLGFESSQPVTTWDDDNDTATPAVPIAVAIPATKTDVTPPAAPYSVGAEWHGDAVSLRWSSSGDADLYGYQVERATDAAGPFSAIGGLALDAENPQARDTTAQAGQTYHYQVLAEDLSDNRSVPSTATAISVP